MTQVGENKKRRLSRREHKVLKKQRKHKKKKSDNLVEQLHPKEAELISENDCARETSRTATTATTSTPSLFEQNHASFHADTISYLQDYVPIPVPPSLEEDSSNIDEGRCTTTINAKSIRGWFPSAHVVKCDAASSSDDEGLNNCSIVLFYQYVAVTNEHHRPWTQRRVQQLQNYLIQVAETRKTVGGRIRISVEGVNATISSLGPQGVRYIQQDLINFDSIAFQHTDFKFIDNLPPDRHFTSMKILPVKELVYYGFHQQEKPYETGMSNSNDNAKINPNVTEDMVAPLHRGGVHLHPRDYHEKLKMDNTVVIDVRNHYEAAIGRFDGQHQQQGAEYIDPKMRKSTDFAQWIQQPQVQDKLKGKQVLMFCTGGIRCERASAYLNTKLGKDINGLYQLKGGIERYMQEFPDGGYWRGKNFVFDKREAVSVNNKAGDGGILVLPKKNNTPTTTSAVCCCCEAPWDRYVGKRKCYTCGVPVLMCDKCMSKKEYKALTNVKGTTTGISPPRCPLCKEQNISIPASQVQYTENGVKGTVTKEKISETEVDKKASTTVLKWGGGHASEKKQLRKMKRKLCRFGSQCVRSDCYFSHPP